MALLLNTPSFLAGASQCGVNTWYDMPMLCCAVLIIDFFERCDFSRVNSAVLYDGQDGVNLVSRSFTRGSAVAERFWSASDVRSVPLATPRLEAFRCNLLNRGIGAEVVYGPSYCPRPFAQPYVPPWGTT